MSYSLALLMSKLSFLLSYAILWYLQHPDDNISPAQEAVLHVQSRIVDLGSDQDGVITTRLLVPSNQIGCLLGRGGSIIADMRKATRANIRILAKDQLPRCALETDELVQVRFYDSKASCKGTCGSNRERSLSLVLNSWNFEVALLVSSSVQVVRKLWGVII